MTTDERPLTCGDYIDAAESAQRGEAWALASALWQRAAETETDPQRMHMWSTASEDCACRQAITNKMEAIAKQRLSIPTLDERKSDSLDFHDIGVAALKRALYDAFYAGFRCRENTIPRAWGDDIL